MTVTTSTERPRIKDFGNVRAWYFGNNPDIVPVCPPVVDKKLARTIDVSNYNNGHTWICEAGGTLTSVSASFTLSSYTITANGTPVSIGGTIAAGALVDLVCLPRQSSGTVSVVLDVTADTTRTVPSRYYACRWTSIRNGAQHYLPQSIGGTSSEAQLAPCIRPSANTFNYNCDAIATASFRGTGEIIMRVNDNGVEWGCGLITTATPTWPSLNLNLLRHGVYLTYADDKMFAYENGANPSLVNFAALTRGVSPQLVWVKIEDTGSAIVYKYSLNAGSTWTTWYTSAQAYTPNTTWYVAIAGATLSQSILGGVYLNSANITG